MQLHCGEMAYTGALLDIMNGSEQEDDTNGTIQFLFTEDVKIQNEELKNNDLLLSSIQCLVLIITTGIKL